MRKNSHILAIWLFLQVNFVILGVFDPVPDTIGS